MTEAEVAALIDAANADINSRLDGIVSQISDVNARLDALVIPEATDLSALETAVANLNSSFSSLAADVAVLTDAPAFEVPGLLYPVPVVIKWAENVLAKNFGYEYPTA